MCWSISLYLNVWRTANTLLSWQWWACLTDCAQRLFLTGRDNSGLILFVYLGTHLYWSPKFLWPCVALEENSTVPGTRVPLDYLHLNDRYDSAFAGLFPFCFVLTLVCISWKRMLLVVCLTCLSFLLSLFICVWSCTWRSAKVCCHRSFSHQFDRTTWFFLQFLALRLGRGQLVPWRAGDMAFSRQRIEYSLSMGMISLGPYSFLCRTY